MASAKFTFHLSLQVFRPKLGIEPNPTIMSQSHYLCGLNSVVPDALWDPGQCSAGRFAQPETLIYQRIGTLEGRAATFTVGSTTNASFSCVLQTLIPQKWVQIKVFMPFISQLLAGTVSCLWFPLLPVHCGVVDGDLFTYTSLWD